MNYLFTNLLRKLQGNKLGGTKEQDTPEFFNQTLKKKTLR